MAAPSIRLDELISAPVGHRLDAAGVSWVKGEEGLDLPITAPELLWYVRRCEAGERWWLRMGTQLIDGPGQRRPSADEAAFRRLELYFGHGADDLTGGDLCP